MFDPAQLYERLDIERTYPQACSEWWGYCKHGVRDEATDKEIIDGWECWIGIDDPYLLEDL